MRREWGVILAGLAVGAAAGLLVMSAQAKTYAATATVLVTPTGVGSDATQANGRTTGVINLDTEAQLVRSTAVAARAEKLDPSFSSAPPRQTVKNVRVSVPANTTILKITYSASTAKRAKSGANAFAEAYLADRRATAHALLSKQIADARRSVASITARLKALSDAEAALPAQDHRRLFDQEQRTLYTNQISTLNQQLIGFAATQITAGRLVTGAALPSSPSSPSAPLDIGSGLAAGLLLGLLIAWRRIAHRRVVRRPDHLAHQIDIPTLAVVRETSSPTAAPVDSADARTSYDEAYRRLAILVSAAVPRPAILVVSSAGPSRSDRTVACGLGVALSQVDAPVRILQVGVGLGTTDVDGLPDVVRVERVEEVRREHGGASLKESLERLRGSRTLLIVSVPCPTAAADALMVAALSDAVLLAVDSGTRTRAVRTAVAAFDEISGPMLGIVLVRHSRLRARERRADRDHVVSARPLTGVAGREPVEREAGHAPVEGHTPRP